MIIVRSYPPKFPRPAMGGYRYFFNGQEGDNEVFGEGVSLTAEFWQYDTRLGRRWNVDPVFKEYESPYACFAGNPMRFADPRGDTVIIPNKDDQDFIYCLLNIQAEKKQKKMKTIKMLVLGLACIFSLVDTTAQSIPIKINIAINRSKIQVYDYNLSMRYRSNKDYIRLKVETRHGRLVAKIPKEDYSRFDSIEVILCEKANSRAVWISLCTTDHYIRPIFVRTATTDKWPYSEIILYSTYPPPYKAINSRQKDYPTEP